MLKISNAVLPSPDQWEAVTRGIRNPYDSHSKSDSSITIYIPSGRMEKFQLGQNDLSLMCRLAKAGDDHGKFLRMLPVLADVDGPLYWWKQIDQYKIGTTTDSESTMHTIMKKPFTKKDFSIDQEQLLISTVSYFNELRNDYMDAEDPEEKEVIWRTLIQLLPSGFNQTRTWCGNYQVLRRIFHARKGHKLKEWEQFRVWIASLPYAKELIVDA